MKLGRIQSVHDPRTLMFDNYRTDLLPEPPAREMLDTVEDWPMLANDRFNCCTSAAAGHAIHHWSAANGVVAVLTDDDIIRAHATLTRDHLLDRVSMLDALKLWRRTGIGAHRIHSFVGARAKDADHLREVIHLFGAAYVGLDLPAFACGPDPATWKTTPWSCPAQATPDEVAPQAGNGHCVTAVGYEEDGVYVVTWGMLKRMSWEFYNAYNFETFAALSHDWVEQDRASPSGFSLDSLVHDLHADI